MLNTVADNLRLFVKRRNESLQTEDKDSQCSIDQNISQPSSSSTNTTQQQPQHIQPQILQPNTRDNFYPPNSSILLQPQEILPNTRDSQSSIDQNISQPSSSSTNTIQQIQPQHIQPQILQPITRDNFYPPISNILTNVAQVLHLTTLIIKLLL
ncbi:unnamed protein product [Gordionus sp. m RMFG-2023]